jgi:F-type H+-transporting ATPase subunit a
LNVVIGGLLPPLNELFDWKGIFSEHTIWAFNKTALMAFVSTAICIGIFVFGARKRSLVPAGLQNIAEAGYEAIEVNVSLQTVGPEAAAKWTPYFATLFFWIFFINIWEIVPGIQFPATSRIAIPMMLAIISWLTFIVVGFKTQGIGYIWKTINPPGVPKALKVLVIPIEFFSTFAMRPFSLTVRLFANMTAGHALLTVFAVMTNELLIVRNSGWYQAVFSPLPFLGLVAFTGFEVLVAVLQAYIFTILTAVYISQSLHPEH